MKVLMKSGALLGQVTKLDVVLCSLILKNEARMRIEQQMTQWDEIFSRRASHFRTLALSQNIYHKLNYLMRCKKYFTKSVKTKDPYRNHFTLFSLIEGEKSFIIQ